MCYKSSNYSVFDRVQKHIPNTDSLGYRGNQLSYCAFNSILFFSEKCSNPTEKGQCPDCGKVIGGEGEMFMTESGELLAKSQMTIADR